MKLWAHIEIHHSTTLTHVVIHHGITGLHGLIHHSCNFQKFLHRIPWCFIQLFRIKSDSCFARKKLTNLSDEINAVFFVLNIITNVHLGIVSLCKPIEDVCHKFEVWVTEILHGYVSVITKCSHGLTEVSKISVWHFELQFCNFKIIIIDINNLNLNYCRM